MMWNWIVYPERLERFSWLNAILSTRVTISWDFNALLRFYAYSLWFEKSNHQIFKDHLSKPARVESLGWWFLLNLGTMQKAPFLLSLDILKAHLKVRLDEEVKPYLIEAAMHNRFRRWFQSFTIKFPKFILRKEATRNCFIELIP